MLRNSKNSKGTRCRGDCYDSRGCSLVDNVLDSRGSGHRSRERADRLSLLELDQERRPRLDDSLLGRRRESSMNDLVESMGAMDIGSRGALRDRRAPRNLLVGGRRRGGDDNLGFQFRPVPFRPGIEADRLLNRERMQRRRPPLVGVGGGYRHGGLSTPLNGLDSRGGLREGLRNGSSGRYGLGPSPNGGIGRGLGGGLRGPDGGMGGGFGGPYELGEGLEGGYGGINNPGNIHSCHHNRFQAPNRQTQNQNAGINLNSNPTHYNPALQRLQLLLDNHDPRALDRERFPYGPYPGWQPNYQHPYVEDYVSQLDPEDWEELQMQGEMMQQMYMGPTQLGNAQLGQTQIGQAPIGQGQGLQLGDLQQALHHQQQLGLMGYGLGNGGLNGLGGQAPGVLNDLDGGLNGFAGGLDGLAGLNHLAQLGPLGTGTLGQDGQGGIAAQGQNDLGGAGDRSGGTHQ